MGLWGRERWLLTNAPPPFPLASRSSVITPVHHSFIPIITMSSNSVEHTPVDPRRVVLHHIAMLEEELERLGATKDNLTESMVGHVDALQEIFNKIKKPVCVPQFLPSIISDCMLALRKSAFQC